MFSLSGKRVLITGAAGGIGVAITKKFLMQGATLAVSGSNEGKLNNFVAELDEKVYPIIADLSVVENAAKLVEEAHSKMGGLDVLICNAGVTNDKLAIRMSDDDFEKVLRVNLMSAFAMNRSAIKFMMKQNFGRIINVASVVAVAGNPGQANYVASKAGLIGMSKSLAIEYASKSITVNVIAPGFIESPMTDKLNEQQKERILHNIPVGKIGQPDDIASAAVYLASDEANYVTGHTLHVNGGMLMV